MGWHKYSDLQIATALEVARILFAEYRLIDVVGHDDISTNHKVDPGPAFPMEGLRSQILDLTAEQLLRYRTTIRLILRSDAGDVYPAQIIGYLPIGKLFEVVARKSGWAQVKSVEEVRRNCSGTRLVAGTAPETRALVIRLPHFLQIFAYCQRGARALPCRDRGLFAGTRPHVAGREQRRAGTSCRLYRSRRSQAYPPRPDF